MKVIHWTEDITAGKLHAVPYLVYIYIYIYVYVVSLKILLATVSIETNSKTVVSLLHVVYITQFTVPIYIYIPTAQCESQLLFWPTIVSPSFAPSVLNTFFTHV
jgi:hypothetical protein